MKPKKQLFPLKQWPYATAKRMGPRRKRKREASHQGSTETSDRAVPKGNAHAGTKAVPTRSLKAKEETLSLDQLIKITGGDFSIYLSKKGVQFQCRVNSRFFDWDTWKKLTRKIRVVREETFDDGN